MKLSGVWSALGKVGKFVYEHPEIIQVVAASTGHAGLAKGIGTVVNAAEVVKAPAAPAPVTPAPETPAPVAPAPAPVESSGLVPDVDIVTKWRGTIDRMAMEILGYRMNEDEYYNNAKLLEAGDVAGVKANIEKKRG